MNPYFPPDQLRELAQAYLDATGISRNALSLRAVGSSNNRVIARLLTGAGCSAEATAALSEFFSREWPIGIAWPGSVPRPVGGARQKIHEGVDANH